VNAIDEPLFVEVDQQPEPKSQQSQVRQRLSLVDWMNGALRLEFDNNQMIHEQVGSKSAFQFDIVVDDGYWLFFHDAETSLP
jgi:hypothetical protein